ncbi:MAG: murein L,D-transpeptidase catalytic domain family protein [Flavobacteriales bacterium]|jgi:hypothetical protein|nr:murein L,D-transpeptidase catalytic domain family protein [Flavobacteriales bacterium]
MLKIPLLILWLFGLALPEPAPLPAGKAGAPVPPPPATAPPTVDAVAELYTEIGLAGELPEAVFSAGYRSVEKHGLKGTRMLAIADMGQPSTAKRLYIIDLEKKELLLRTYVAHGQKSGELMATDFSNKVGSHQTSLGLYRVGAEIVSPKHGPALLLHGLDKGVNCKALAREVIMHGADYVSPEFIAEHGRLGRSWGCPAVERAEMGRMIELLADGGSLYIYAKHRS